MRTRASTRTRSVPPVRAGGAALLIATLALAACGGPAERPESAEPAPPAASAPGGTASTGPGQAGNGTASQVPETLRFTARTVDGQTFDAASLASRPTVFWFWAAWCPECRAHAEDVAAVQREYADRVNVVGVVGLDSGADAMRDFIRERKISNFVNLADDDGAVWRRFRVASQDQYVILDRAGRVVHSGSLTPAALRQRVNALS